MSTLLPPSLSNLLKEYRYVDDSHFGKDLGQKTEVWKDDPTPWKEPLSCHTKLSCHPIEETSKILGRMKGPRPSCLPKKDILLNEGLG